MHKIVFYNKFIIFLYMFRALRAHHQEVKIVLYSICYHHTETSEWSKITKIHFYKYEIYDRLCGLVVRVSGYRYRGPGFDPRRYQIFWVVVGLERGPLSLVSIVRSIEELLEWKK